MPYEISFNDLPAGYSVTSANNGEMAMIAIREFISSEDGDEFISRLEGFPSEIIHMLPPERGIKPSIVDHMLVIIRRDKTATVYVNELTIISEVMTSGREMEAGQPVFFDDIADIRKLTFHGISIPEDSGILFLFSHEWRKGLFYDFSALSGKVPAPRDYNLEMLCGQYYAYLCFQYLFKITEDEWNRMLAQQWFPFIALRKRTIEEILSYVRNRWDVDRIIEKIAEDLTKAIPVTLTKWENNPLFRPHLAFFKQAVDRFAEGDYISATSILYPRIEGLMRTFHIKTNAQNKASQKNLVSSVIESKGRELHSFSLLLPSYFRRYLEEVYFANFDPTAPNVLSRNTVSHGVAPVEFFSKKGAIIGLLILDQLWFYMSPYTES
jgi:hypothetical protein